MILLQVAAYSVGATAGALTGLLVSHQLVWLVARYHHNKKPPP